MFWRYSYETFLKITEIDDVEQIYSFNDIKSMLSTTEGEKYFVEKIFKNRVGVTTDYEYINEDIDFTNIRIDKGIPDAFVYKTFTKYFSEDQKLEDYFFKSSGTIKFPSQQEKKRAMEEHDQELKWMQEEARAWFEEQNRKTEEIKKKMEEDYIKTNEKLRKEREEEQRLYEEIKKNTPPGMWMLTEFEKFRWRQQGLPYSDYIED